MNLKTIPVLLVLAGILAIPFLLRPRTPQTEIPQDETERLVIITPHSESIKYEWEQAFRKHYRRKFGRDIILDYRSPGGTSDIMRYIADRYQTEFRRYCTERGLPWNERTAAAFSRNQKPGAPADAVAARKAFLESDVSIGIDLMAGGGTFELARNADAGFAVDAKIKELHPELLAPEIIPQSFGGELLYDPKGRYYGLCLSTFGLCYNLDRIRELEDKTPPRRWADLGEPRFFNKIVIGDPSKSGSINKCFEIMIQQKMAELGSPERGWHEGLNLIKRIIANAFTITDSAGKVTRDVAAGAAAAGMAIDTYGLTEREWSAIQFRGEPHFNYVAPEGGTAVSPDPIQLLRGAPNRKAAVELIAFLLSPEGQKLMCFNPGTPGGPLRSALRRPPIRRDLYDKKFETCRSDPDYNPYASGSSFTYHPEWTGRYYTLLRVVLRTIMLDCLDELRDAWKAIIDAGGPNAVPEAMEYFNRLPFEYKDAAAAAQSLRRTETRSAVDIARTKRQWRDSMRADFHRAAELARTKKAR